MYQTGYYATGYYATGYYSRALLLATTYTWFSLVFEARQLLEDEGLGDCPIRYTDAQLISALNRGLQELGRIRPDAFYDTFSANSLNVIEVTDAPPDPDQTFWADQYTLSGRFYPALVYYVVSQMDMTEDEYVASGQRHPHGSRAAGGLRLFRTHVLSV